VLVQPRNIYQHQNTTLKFHRVDLKVRHTSKPAHQIPMRELIDTIETFVIAFSSSTYDFMGWWGLIVLMSIESTAIPLPSEVIMPLAGWMLVADKDLGFEYVVMVGLMGAIGSLLGSLAEYYASRAGGRPVIEKFGKYMLITRKDLERADKWFETRGEITIFVARMIPGVRGFISIPAGIARMNVIKFSIFTFLGALPWTFGLAWGGYALGSNYEDIRHVTRPFDVPIILGVLALIALFLWKRIRELRAEAAELRAAVAAEPEQD
jgi:membrane protein DedA with SNARE-associated domain